MDYKSSSGNSYDEGKYAHGKTSKAEKRYYNKFKTANAIFSDDKEGEKAVEFYVDVLKNIYEFTTDDVSLYWWFAQNVRDIENRIAWFETGWRVSGVLLWLKERMILSINSDYHRCYEPCLFGWKAGNTHFMNKKITNLKDVFMLEEHEFKNMPDVWYEHRDDTANYVHPTQKPVRLAERALKKNSVPGDIVLDAFGGSGSTLMACEQMQRKCRVMELDPKYCDVIVDRWEKFTGNKAEVV